MKNIGIHRSIPLDFPNLNAGKKVGAKVFL
jgi:hypothetical protein